jgi:hypothetical protein
MSLMNGVGVELWQGHKRLATFSYKSNQLNLEGRSGLCSAKPARCTQIANHAVKVNHKPNHRPTVQISARYCTEFANQTGW